MRGLNGTLKETAASSGPASSVQPVRDYLDQVQRASDAHLYYLSLAGALLVPDMAGAAEAEDGIAKPARYVSWFDRYVAAHYPKRDESPIMSGTDCWGLRCSLLHQGRLAPHQGSFSRVLFIEPGATTNFFHLGVQDDALHIDVTRFVADVVSGALTWLDAVEDSAVYQRNYSESMQRYPEGLAPYIGGVPVIA